jgi:hypothetical protein
LILFASCTTAPVQSPQPETSQTFQQPFDKVWGAAVAEITKEYPLKVIDKSSGILETDIVTIGTGIGAEQTLKQCAISPRVFLGTWGEARAKLSVYARADSTNTFLRIRAHIEAFENNVTKSWHVWESNGVLERKTMQGLARDL